MTGDVSTRGPMRRRAIKNFAYSHLLMRSVLVFLYMYISKIGFLDGRIGFRYCLIHTFHEYQISLKLIELRDPGSPLATKYKEFVKR